MTSGVHKYSGEKRVIGSEYPMKDWARGAGLSSITMRDARLVPVPLSIYDGRCLTRSETYFLSASLDVRCGLLTPAVPWH